MDTNKQKTAQPVKDPKGKFQEWENMLVGKDIHSIRNQIYDMFWDCTFFRCINESRRYAGKDDDGNIKRNGPLHSFINQSFFKTQLLSIRRLTDNRSDVYSLYRLIEDIKKNMSILTRKNILDSRNLPYDYEKAMAAFKKEIGYTKGPFMVPPEIASSEDIHRRIDSMVGIVADKRSPDDLFPNNILEQFNDKLASIDELCKYVNKFIAHAATPESRKVIFDEIEGALGKVLNAHKIICETASFIGNKILFCGLGYVLPIPRYGPFDQFDVFEYLDEPMASKETVEKIRQVWETYRTETEQWANQWYN
jgi:hypothetical protein